MLCCGSRTWSGLAAFIAMSWGAGKLRAGASLIDLVPVDPPSAGGGNMDHFALRIAPFEEASLRAHLTAAGLEVGQVEVRYGAEGSGPSLYIEDPDGNVVELKGPA
jgi:catechol 2,3-dioxygenase-like lactoylglutathione lyase family enzyme